MTILLKVALNFISQNAYVWEGESITFYFKVCNPRGLMVGLS